jgi:hypothetical protein
VRRASVVLAAVAGLVVLVATRGVTETPEDRSSTVERTKHRRPPSSVEWPDAARLRALRRASVWRPPVSRATAPIRSDRAETAPISCRYQPDALSGTTPKFECITDTGDTIKVKYGGPEPHGEVAATSLLRALGFPADDVRFVERVRCFGCPTFPFLMTKVLGLVNALNLYERTVDYTEYADLSWPAVERKHAGLAIETTTRRGWSWFELSDSMAAPRAHVDALRLVAVFLAHWDNKSENQRLVCLDSDARLLARQQCSEPIAFIQDLGATFGPRKVDLESWRDTPVWADRNTCRVTMERLPHGGGTFPPTQISEAGRRFLAERLGPLTRSDIRTLLERARFAEYDGRDVAGWIQTFERKVHDVTDGPPCPAR